MKITKIFKNKPMLILIIALCVVLITALSITYISSNKHSLPVEKENISLDNKFKDFSIMPLVSDSAGVDVKSSFKILCEAGSSEVSIKSALKITPLQNYRIKKVSSKEFNLIFEKNMEPNKIYKFELANTDNLNTRSWAFQTQKAFKVIRTLPRDKGTSVPVDTGIEISFNYENMESLDNYFEILPKTKGSFEYHKKTVVFVPESLEADTLYTITIKKGLSIKGSEEKTQEDFTFSFQTQYNAEMAQITDSFSFSDTLYNITSKITPTLEIFAAEELKEKDISVNVYKYPDETGFIKDMKKYDAYPSWAYLLKSRISSDTSGLKKVMSFNTKMVTGGDGVEWGYPHYLVLPATLPEGHYVITSKIDNATQETHLQVNDSSVYISVIKDQSLVWVNSSETGSPITGATVEVEGLEAAKTGDDGVALITKPIPVPKTGNHYYFKVSMKNKPVFVGLAEVSRNYSNDDYSNGLYQYYYNNEIQNSYWTYMYLDRGIYLPGDTVKIWGTVKTRGKAALITKATLQLVPSSYSYSDTSSIIEAKEVTLSPFGTFEGQFDYTRLNSGYYSVQLVSGNEVLTSNHFEIKQYTKPAYKISITADKKAIFAWNKANFDIQASFYEGTPVSGLKLNYYQDYTSQHEGSLKCDDNGHTTLSLTPAIGDDTWQPRGLSLNVHNAQAEEQEVSSNSYVTVFPRDTMLEINAKKTGSTAKVEIRASSIDFKKIKNENDYYDKEKFRGSSVDIPLKITIMEKHWDSKEIATHYDFISKKTYKEYEYFEVNTMVADLASATANGLCNLDFPAEKNKVYSITVTGFDSRNNLVKETQTFYFDYYDSKYAPRKGYSLQNLTPKDSYLENDKISLTTVANTSDTPQTSGFRCLYLTLKNGYQGYKIINGNDYSFNFTKEFIPNLYVAAVCFDGTNVFSAGMKNFVYDSKQKALKIELRTDKAQYKPGETVQVKITSKDQKGNPVVAAVNLSVVDEAFFAIQDQYVDTLSSLYNYNIPSGMLTYYISYTPIDPNSRNSMAEQGGEGGDAPAIRYKFKDTAFFGSIVTDSRGSAELSFKLPDNLTSWRLTYQGITEDIKAGNGRVNISTKLPFFTDIIFNNIFMTGDSPYLTARAFGTELKSGDKVEYSVLLDNNSGTQKNFSVTAPSRDFAGVPLGKLEKGSYSVTVTAKYGQYKDAIKRDFKVADNILEGSQAKFYPLSETLKLKGGEALTNLTFYNKNSSPMYNTLSSLMFEWGDRLDQKLSKKIAAELMRKYYSKDDSLLFFEEEETQFGNYQLSDGGIALLSYDSSNPELSAKICSVAKDRFDTGALKYYFYNILDNKDSTPEDVAASYWGLASLGEPVLLDIKNLLSASDIGLKEKLYLSTALCELGDFTSAKDTYTKILKANSKDVKPYIYIDSQGTRDDSVELTALGSVVAMKLNTPEKLSLYNYVRENSAKDILTNLEQLMFVTNSIPDPLPQGKFTYSFEGTTKEITLNKNDTFMMTLTKEKLAQLKFSKITGDIGVTSRFIGPVTNLLENPNNLVTLSREYRVNGKITTTFNRSDLIQITLHPSFSENAPDGFYQITDILPAGLRYVDSPNDNNKWYPEEVSGQKTVYGFCNNKNNPIYSNRGSYVIYYARAVCPGEFTADNSLIKHYDSDTSGFTEKIQVKIAK